MTFEENLNMLEEIAEKIKDPKTGLEDSLSCYEKGMEKYKECVKLLDEANQKIMVFRG